MPEGAAGKDLHAGLTAIKPGDGAVVAMYGGADYPEDAVQLRHRREDAGRVDVQAVHADRRALQDQISTKTKFDGNSPQYFDEFKDYPRARSSSGKVDNFAGEQFGQHRPAQGDRQLGQHRLRAAQHRGRPEEDEGGRDRGRPAGNRAWTRTRQRLRYATRVSVRDMANAYATIAAQGVRATPYLVKERHGRPRRRSTTRSRPRSRPVPSTRTPWLDTIDAMTQPIDERHGRVAQSLGRPAAGKTGTTTENKSAWFDGFTPQLATAGRHLQAATASRVDDQPRRGSASSTGGDSPGAGSGPTT